MSGHGDENEKGAQSELSCALASECNVLDLGRNLVYAMRQFWASPQVRGTLTAPDTLIRFALVHDIPAVKKPGAQTKPI